MSIRNDGYVNLANAIVQKAAEDYLSYKKRLYLMGYDGDPYDERKGVMETLDKLKDVERFFKSKWYMTLTNLNSDVLVRKLDQEFEEWKLEHELKKA